jgi:dihydroorotate dehydrogenase electron transfer subunit
VPHTVEQPVMARVLENREEASELATLRLESRMAIQPGQFAMLWVPGLDEKPYTVSGVAPGEIAVTVRKRGAFSGRLLELKPGDRVGVRGPYGRGYRPRSRGILVAGGCGLATLAPLKEMLPETPLIFGAKTESELFFLKRFPDMLLCTDDGSAGERCFPTDLLRPRLERGEAEVVYTCGPEVMMRAVFGLCEEFAVECQACLERYMKCGFGVCGQCACGDRLVCLDGPVFLSDDLRRMNEFGKTARLKSGKSVSIREYADWRSC